MMRGCINRPWAIAMILGAIASLPATAADRASIRFEPSTPWNIDYDDDSCALRRNFAADGKTVKLEMRRFQPDGAMTFTVAAPIGQFSEARPRLRILPDAKAHDAALATLARFGADSAGFTWLDDLAAADPAPLKTPAGAWDRLDRERRERSITGIELHAIADPPIVLATGELFKPMEAMRACTDELLNHWGIDAGAQKTLTRKVKAKNWGIVAKAVGRTYPKELLAKEQNGIVRVRFIVDENGKPKSCHIQRMAGDQAFADLACSRMMSYAQFEPALDSTGKPVASYFTTSVTYVVN